MAADDTADLSEVSAVSAGDDAPTPAVVTTAIAAGVVPLPFLAVYALIFIVHGTVRPVTPPDITTTKGGELVAGLIAAGLFVVFAVAVYELLHARRRWAFVLFQLATLGTCIWLITDRSSGPLPIPVVLSVTSLTAAGCALHPISHRFISGSQNHAS